MSQNGYILQSIIEVTGLFRINCCELRAKAAGTTFIVTFFTHFREADKENGQETITLAGEYQAHNLVYININEIMG